MTDHLTVAREGVVRVYKMNGNGAEETVTLRVAGALPDDGELAVWAGALVHMSEGGGAPAKPNKGRKAIAPASRALPRPAPRKPEQIRSDTLAAFADGDWHTADSVQPAGVSRLAWKSGVRLLEQEGLLEKRLWQDWTYAPKAGRQPYEYRLKGDIA